MNTSTSDQEYYKHGYDNYVAKTHEWRTAKNSRPICFQLSNQRTRF